MKKLLFKLNMAIDAMTVSQTSCAVTCALISLIFALALSLGLRAAIPYYVWRYFALLILILFVYGGYRFGLSHWAELLSFIRRGGHSAAVYSGYPAPANMSDKILDTNALIDGRIVDIIKLGWLEGAIIIPQFVLQELRKIADSGDLSRKAFGRRGLDVVAKLQSIEGAAVLVDDSMMNITDNMSNDSDMLLLKLAMSRGGSVVTNDVNLKKTAMIMDVSVLNINDLAQALRPSLDAGDERQVHLVREGREAGQGVGYLDDGTIVFVENGKQYIGETVDIIISRIHHAPAGRMAFAALNSRSTGGP